MTDQELIAKQAAIIQAQEIELNELKNIKDEFEQYKIKKFKEELDRFHHQENIEKICKETEKITNVIININKEEIEFLRNKLKKRPKFIIIINRRKKNVK